jgi:poly(hydroxyalkanoate) granule-associated protein
MVRKLKSLQQQKAASAGLMDSQIAGAVKDSAQQIWLAGMGAFAKAQEEGGKVFDALVKEGMSLQKKTQGMAEDKISEVTGKMSAMAETVTSKAGQNWDKLESLFEQRTAKALSKLGVPTAKDVDALVKRVEALTAQVAKLNGKAPATKAAPKATRAAATKRATPKSASKAAPKAATQAPVKRTAGKRAARTQATA